MCPAGCDEGYLKCMLSFVYSSYDLYFPSITAYCAEHDLSADECVENLRNAVYTETKLTVSAGIAPNLVCRFCDTSSIN